MKVKAVFSKTGDMRFISHLDLMRLFQRALRRASMPVAITQGYSPHIKISIRKALKLGMESDNEELTINLSREVQSAVLEKSLNENLPDGIRITKCEEL